MIELLREGESDGVRDNDESGTEAPEGRYFRFARSQSGAVFPSVAQKNSRVRE